MNEFHNYAWCHAVTGITSEHPLAEGGGDDKKHIHVFRSFASMRSRNRRKSKTFLTYDARKTAARGAYMTRTSEGVSRYARARACVHVASARTIREIAQGSLIPADCALFVAVVQATAKKKATWPRGSDRGQLPPLPLPPFSMPTYFASVEFFLIELGTHRLRMRRKWNVSEGTPFLCATDVEPTSCISLSV